MTDLEDARVIARLRERVAAAGKLPFLTVDTRHLRALFARLDELDPQIPADGVVAALLMQSAAADAPGDWA